MISDAYLAPVPRLLEVHEVAYQLTCSPETVRRLIREKKLPAIRFGHRSLRVKPADLAAFIDARRISSALGLTLTDGARGHTCPDCQAQSYYLALVDGLMHCFRCWKTWVPREALTLPRLAGSPLHLPRDS